MTKKIGKKMNQDDIRTMNYLLVLKLLREQGSSSMADLVSQTKLTFPSISSIISELEYYGIVKNVGVVQAQRGRFPKMYQFNGESYHIIGLSIQSDTVSVGFVNLDGRVCEFATHMLSGTKTASKVIEICVSLIRQLLDRTSLPKDTILGVGVSMHGIVDPTTGTSIYPSHLKWHDFPLLETLKQYVDIPMMVDSDINCLLLAEKCFGQGRDLDSFVIVNVDYGIGAGIVSNGSILHGVDFGSGQIGHIPIRENGVECDCGKVGCLETMASEKAIIRYIKQRVAEGYTERIYHHIDTDNHEVLLEEVYQAATEQEPLATEAIKQAGRSLGEGISILVNILNPKRIILTGGITRGIDTLLPILLNSVNRYALSTNVQNLEITGSQLGTHVEIIGAATLWIEALLYGKIPFSTLASSHQTT